MITAQEACNIAVAVIPEDIERAIREAAEKGETKVTITLATKSDSLVTKLRNYGYIVTVTVIHSALDDSLLFQLTIDWQYPTRSLYLD